MLFSHEKPVNGVLENFNADREIFQNMSQGSKLKPEPDRPSEPKLRKCLKCSKEFMSEHIGERICPKCKVKKG